MSAGVGYPRTMLHTVAVTAVHGGGGGVGAAEAGTTGAVTAGAEASGRGNGGQMSGAEDGDGVRLAGVAVAGRHGELHVRRGESADGGEIALAGFERSSVLGIVYGGGGVGDLLRMRVLVTVRLVSLGKVLRRGLGRATRNVNDNGVVYRLAVGVKVVEGAAHVLVGLEQAVLLVAGVYADVQVWGIKRLAERVGVLAEDNVADVVDEVVLANGDESRRGARAADPDLAGTGHVGQRRGGVLGSRVEGKVSGASGGCASRSRTSGRRGCRGCAVMDGAAGAGRGRA